MIEETCASCEKQVAERHYALTRRIEVVHFGETDEISVLYAENMYFYCNYGCWVLHEQAVIEELRLTKSYPDFGEVSDCCRCCSPVDRKYAYVAYTLMNEECSVKPWLTSVHVHSDEEFAILCNQCESPNFETEEEAVGEDESAQNRLLCELNELAASVEQAAEIIED